MLFTLRFIESLPDIIFDGTPIKFVTEHKHLGLTLSSNGQWHCHIENIIKNASKVIGIMRKLKFTFSRVALNQIYLSYLLPIIEYSCVVWAGCTVQDINSLQKLQIEAACIVTGLTRSVSLDNLYRECGWVSLAERRRQQKFIFMYKSINRTEISRKSCIPTSISAWNSLDVELRNSQSLANFKYQLKKLQNNSNVPTYYRTGSRYLSVLHARIKNYCSNFVSDLYINHLSPRPTCSCSEEVEDADHYFLIVQTTIIKEMHF